MLNADGYLMIDGLRIPVVGVSLSGGKTVLHGHAAGPLPPSASGSRALTVFGSDGTGICQGYTTSSWRSVAAGEVLDLTVDMSMQTCYGDAEDPGEQQQGG